MLLRTKTIYIYVLTETKSGVHETRNRTKSGKTRNIYIRVQNLVLTEPNKINKIWRSGRSGQLIWRLKTNLVLTEPKTKCETAETVLTILTLNKLHHSHS